MFQCLIEIEKTETNRYCTQSENMNAGEAKFNQVREIKSSHSLFNEGKLAV